MIAAQASVIECTGRVPHLTVATGYPHRSAHACACAHVCGIVRLWMITIAPTHNPHKRVHCWEKDTDELIRVAHAQCCYRNFVKDTTKRDCFLHLSRTGATPTTWCTTNIQHNRIPLWSISYPCYTSCLPWSPFLRKSLRTQSKVYG